MVPLLQISNIASSMATDSCYVAVQLAGYIVVWLHSCGWTVLSHWPVTDEVNTSSVHVCVYVVCVRTCVCVCAIFGILQLDLMYFYTLSLTGGVAICTVTKTGMWR